MKFCYFQQNEFPLCHLIKNENSQIHNIQIMFLNGLLDGIFLS